MLLICVKVALCIVKVVIKLTSTWRKNLWMLIKFDYKMCGICNVQHSLAFLGLIVSLSFRYWWHRIVGVINIYFADLFWTSTLKSCAQYHSHIWMCTRAWYAANTFKVSLCGQLYDVQWAVQYAMSCCSIITCSSCRNLEDTHGAYIKICIKISLLLLCGLHLLF